MTPEEQSPNGKGYYKNSSKKSALERNLENSLVLNKGLHLKSQRTFAFRADDSFLQPVQPMVLR
eukprot:CCRYP_016328-RA/>CCRYP_016328-RA protein AED:0.31 eAED:0.37 QI:0/0.33/0.25/1/0/0/4/297/63